MTHRSKRVQAAHVWPRKRIPQCTNLFAWTGGASVEEDSAVRLILGNGSSMRLAVRRLQLHTR